jgi:hypothetical protein
MWIESSFDVDGRHFRVSAKRLVDHERERMAAEIAWFAHDLLTPDVDFEAIGWTTLLQRILSEYVAITVDEDTLDRLDSMWDQVVRRALRVFMQVNELDLALKRSLRAARTCVS